MNPRQKLFAENYCGKCCGNAVQAAIAAGYSLRYAQGNAYKLVENSGVREYIEEINAKTTQKNIATISDIKAFWTSVMNDENEETKNRLRASELFARSVGMFNNEW